MLMVVVHSSYQLQIGSRGSQMYRVTRSTRLSHQMNRLWAKDFPTGGHAKLQVGLHGLRGTEGCLEASMPAFIQHLRMLLLLDAHHKWSIVPHSFALMATLEVCSCLRLQLDCKCWQNIAGERDLLPLFVMFPVWIHSNRCAFFL
jgi:hypothetical protein